MRTSPAPRPLVEPALGLAAGIALAGSTGGGSVPFWVVGLVSLVIAPVLGANAGRCLVVLGFFALGLARGAAPVCDPPPPEQDEALLWRVELRRAAAGDVLSVPVVLRDARREPGAALTWRGSALAELRTGGWPAEGRPPERGDVWLVRGRLAPALRAGPPVLWVVGPRRLARLAASEGRLDRLGSGADRALLHARRRVRRAVDRSAPPEQRGLLLALALGDRRDVEPSLREDFARTGTAHLLAISGLHVGCLAGVLLIGGRVAIRRLPLPLNALQAGLPDRLAWGLAVVGASLYVVVAGMPVSGRRALVMLICAAAGSLLDRRTGGWNGLAGAALLVAWFEPSAVRSAGYQLSVASVAGLLALGVTGSGSWRRWWVLRWLAGALGSSAAATLATAPLCAALFGRVPIAGLWVNVVAIPILGVGTVPALLLGCALGAVNPALGGPAIRLAALCSDLGCRVVGWCAVPARCPVIAWEPGPLVVPGLYLAASLALFCLGRPGARPPEDR